MTSCMSSKRSNHLGYASGDGVYYIIPFAKLQEVLAIFLKYFYPQKKKKGTLGLESSFFFFILFFVLRIVSWLSKSRSRSGSQRIWRSARAMRSRLALVG